MNRYHVTCPISKKRFDFETIPQARRFVMAMMKKYPECKSIIQIKEGRKLYAKMWRAGRYVYYRRKGRRLVSIVAETGNLRS